MSKPFNRIDMVKVLTDAVISITLSAIVLFGITTNPYRAAVMIAIGVVVIAHVIKSWRVFLREAKEAEKDSLAAPYKIETPMEGKN